LQKNPTIGMWNGLWLGTTDIAQEGTFIWQSSGKAVNYTNWYSPNPDGGTGQNCLLLNFYHWGWDDEFCNATVETTMCEMIFPCY
jgi:hypothetical protein